MESRYKTIAWMLAAGGAILGTAFVVNYLWKPKKPRLDRQSLQKDVKKIGSLRFVSAGIIEKKQMAHIVALAQHHAASYDCEQRQKLRRERLAYLTMHNWKAYLQAAINSLNFEYACTQTICAEIATLLELSSEDLASSQEYYLVNKDSEYSETVVGIAAELARSQGLPKLVHDNAEQYWVEYETLTVEFGRETDMEPSTETKMKLDNPDTSESKAALVEVRVCDELFLKHKINPEYIQRLAKVRKDKLPEAKSSNI